MTSTNKRFENTYTNLELTLTQSIMNPLRIPAGVGNSVDLDNVIFYSVIDCIWKSISDLSVNAEVYSWTPALIINDRKSAKIEVSK